MAEYETLKSLLGQTFLPQFFGKKRGGGGTNSFGPAIYSFCSSLPIMTIPLIHWPNLKQIDFRLFLRFHPNGQIKDFSRYSDF